MIGCLLIRPLAGAPMYPPSHVRVILLASCARRGIGGGCYRWPGGTSAGPTQFIEAHVVEAKIRRRRMQRPERAVAEQLLEPRGFEDPVRAAERQRRAGNPA